MKKNFTVRKLFLAMAAAGVMSYSHCALSSAFQLFEQDAASIGNYHAGMTATADDASTAFYNPAGLVRIKNQQLVVGVDPILTNIKFKGTVSVNTFIPPNAGPLPTTAQAGGFNAVPFLHYAAPITDRIVVAFSTVAPFGLDTDYSRATPAQYAATLSSLKVIDFTPSIGIALNDKFSVGGGVDFEHISAQLNQTAGALNPIFNSLSKNEGTGNAWGYHLGMLYQFTEATRAGISYHSQVSHHITGNSYLEGPLAIAFAVPNSNNLFSNVTLPAMTSASIFHTYNSAFDLMANVSYTQWESIQNIKLHNVSGISGGLPSNTITAVLHQFYRNTWNASVGANYHATECVTLRTGLGFDQTPVQNHYRSLRLPDNDRYVIALGTHFQATKTIGFDLSWNHLFSPQASINNDTQTNGDETVVANGHVNSSADVFAFGLKWDIV